MFRKCSSTLLRALCLVPSLLITALAQPADGQGSSAGPAVDPRITAVISRLEEVRSLEQTALSPDGRRVAWVVTRGGGSEIEVAPMDDPHQAHRLTAGSGPVCAEGKLAWSPDSRDLAFTSDCQTDGQADLYLQSFEPKAGRASASPRRISHLHGDVDGLAFSPDGKQIGFLYVEGATRRPGALDAMKPPSGVIGVEGLEIQRVAALDLSSGQVRQVTPLGLHVYEYDWSPDSRQLAYVAAPPPGENNWWVAQLYTEDLSRGAPRPVLDPDHAAGPLHGLQIAVPRWSPDGRQIAFIGGLMSDQGATGGDLYMIPAGGGSPRRIGLGSKPEISATWIHWARQDRIGVSYVSGGSSGFAEVSPDDNTAGMLVQFETAATVTDGRLEMSLSMARDGRVAMIESSYAKPPEVYAGTFQDLRQITHVNDSIRPLWGKAESIDWKSDNFHVQGWLLYPANYDPAKKYPLIVGVHGGPSSVVVPRWPSLGYTSTAFSALGYFVLMPNPRGSYGQGEAFTQANRKDFGYGDLRDILAGVDTVTARFPIDSQRIGITGWSYGGFMTMFAVTQTNRFHAAVAGAGIANWQSYYGENSIDRWMVPFFGASVYNDPGAYAKSSAINFIHNVKTPTLVVVGDRDGECPAPQSFEFWHALRAEHVPTQLVVYPDEGHRFVSPEHRRDVLERALAWFEQYMPAQKQELSQGGRE